MNIFKMNALEKAGLVICATFSCLLDCYFDLINYYFLSNTFGDLEEAIPNYIFIIYSFGEKTL